MKTRTRTLFYFLFIAILGSCELNSETKQSGLPQPLSVFKFGTTAGELKSLFPGYASHLNYESYWKENFNGEEVYAVPTVIDSKNMAVLYVGVTQKSGLEVRIFGEEKANVTFTDLNQRNSVSWNGVKIADHLYSFDFDLQSSTSNGRVSVKETYPQCVGRVYDIAKRACNADNICSAMCDVIPSCRASMLAAAAWTCI